MKLMVFLAVMLLMLMATAAQAELAVGPLALGESGVVTMIEDEAGHYGLATSIKLSQSVIDATNKLHADSLLGKVALTVFKEGLKTFRLYAVVKTEPGTGDWTDDLRTMAKPGLGFNLGALSIGYYYRGKSEGPGWLAVINLLK